MCKPLWIRIRRTPPLLYILIVTLFAFGFNIPKFMEFEVRPIMVERLLDCRSFCTYTVPEKEEKRSIVKRDERCTRLGKNNLDSAKLNFRIKNTLPSH